MLSIRPYITVLSHERNKGKGAALKSGFRHIIKLFPHTRGVIMADGDGQHIPQDVAKIASEGAKRPHMMTLGSRLLHRTEMPVKSKIGNAIARGSLKFFFGVDVTDNQTGLRFVPARMLPTMATLSGNHFDYEMNMLIRAADDHVGIREVPIETVYRKKGHISHYHPWRDTFRVVLLVTVAFFSRRIYV
jgi:glycosyltransferase involved in cell wall biosynthesis